MDPLLKDFWIKDAKAAPGEEKLRGPYDFHFLKTLEGIAVVKADTLVFEDSKQTWTPWGEIRQRKLTVPEPASPAAASESAPAPSPVKKAAPNPKPLNIVIPKYNASEAFEAPFPTKPSSPARNPLDKSNVPSEDAVAAAVAAAKAAKLKAEAEATELARQKARAKAEEEAASKPQIQEVEWYFMQFGEQVGPSTTSNLIELLNIGKVARDTLVWTDGMADWAPANETEALARYLTPERAPESQPIEALPAPAAAVAGQKKKLSAQEAKLQEEQRMEALQLELAASRQKIKTSTEVKRGAMYYITRLVIGSAMIAGAVYLQYKYNLAQELWKVISDFFAQTWDSFNKFISKIKFF